MIPGNLGRGLRRDADFAPCFPGCVTLAVPGLRFLICKIGRGLPAAMRIVWDGGWERVCSRLGPWLLGIVFRLKEDCVACQPGRGSGVEGWLG